MLYFELSTPPVLYQSFKENDDGPDFLELSQQKFSESNTGDGHGTVRGWSLSSVLQYIRSM